jgi:hypothetical protein
MTQAREARSPCRPRPRYKNCHGWHTTGRTRGLATASTHALLAPRKQTVADPAQIIRDHIVAHNAQDFDSRLACFSPTRPGSRHDRFRGTAELALRHGHYSSRTLNLFKRKLAQRPAFVRRDVTVRQNDGCGGVPRSRLTNSLTKVSELDELVTQPPKAVSHLAADPLSPEGLQVGGCARPGLVRLPRRPLDSTPAESHGSQAGIFAKSRMPGTPRGERQGSPFAWLPVKVCLVDDVLRRRGTGL